MTDLHYIQVLVAFLVVGRWFAELVLDRLNLSHVRRHADEVPVAFQGTIDPSTYKKSVEYTLAKGGLSQWMGVYDLVILLIVLFSGFLPWTFELFTGWLGTSIWSTSLYLFFIGVVMSLPALPWDWYSEFRLEERFGFNTTTMKIWITDRVKGVILSLLLGYPLLVLVLKLVEWMGNAWWLWAWGVFMVFQLIMIVVAPILILPLFNKFTSLPDGSLKDRLLALGEKTGFTSRTIQVMDGSKRSKHSNAFFTGFGRFRKIVLFDTLVDQLEENELEAVLAHEIGHFKKRHVHKIMAWSAVSLLFGLFVLAWLAKQAWFYQTFGFEMGNIVPAFLLFGLLSGTVTFWFTPVANLWSRRYEYQADRYAADTMDEFQSLTGALRKLNEKNLSNLTPHPIYSGFYYSHPTLLERESALQSS